MFVNLYTNINLSFISEKRYPLLDVAFLLVFSRYFCYNKGNKFVKVTHIMDYMHLLVGRPTQKSKKLEVCYILGDTTYVRPKRLKEDAKVDFIDWPDTVLGRLQRAYDRVPLKQDRDNVLTDYRKLVACLKDAFIVLTDGSYESSELFEETCSDSELRRVFLVALEIFKKDIPRVLRSKTNDVWDLLEELETSEIPDKAVFNRLQERYLEKGFSVFALPEALVGHHYSTIVDGSKTYQNLLFDLIRPFDARFLTNTALTTLAKIEHGDFKSETIDGQLLNVIGDWLCYLDVVDRQVTVHELSKEERVRSYKTIFEKFQAYGGSSGVSLHLFNDVKLSSVSLDELKEELLKPKNRVAVDSVSSEMMPLEQMRSLLDNSLSSLKVATSECASDAIEISEGFESDVATLDEAIMSTSEEHQSNSLYYSEALSEPIGVFEDLGSKSMVSTWSADNNEFRELASSETLKDYAVKHSVDLFDLESKEDIVGDYLKKIKEPNVVYVKQSIADLSDTSEAQFEEDVLFKEIPKKDTFYVESLHSEEDIFVSDVSKKDAFPTRPVFQIVPDALATQSLVVTDTRLDFYESLLESALDALPPKDVLKNVYVDYKRLRDTLYTCLLQDFLDYDVIINELIVMFDAIGRGDYANDDVLRGEKITFLRSGLIRCLLEFKRLTAPLCDNQTDDKFGFDVKTVQSVLHNLVETYGRNEGIIERWFSISDDIKALIKQALDYVSNDTMFINVPVSLKNTEFSDWLSDKECDALSQLLFFDAKKTDWYRSKAIEKDLMERYKNCSLLPLDFLKDDTVTNPSRYRKNAIEAWDFTIQSLLPHPLATVAEYVIRYPYKGGCEDLEKALAWAKKAEQSLPYLQATVGYGDGIVDDLPKVTKDMFPDCSEGQRDVLRAVQKATLALRGSLGYGDPEEALQEVTDKVMELLDEL